MGLRVEHEGFGPAWLSFDHIAVARTDKKGNWIVDDAGNNIYDLEHTVARLSTSDHRVVAEGHAYKHPKDIYVKETGRQQALKRLIAQLKALGYPGSYLGAVFNAYRNRTK